LKQEAVVVSELSRKAIFHAAHPCDNTASDLNDQSGGYLERLKATNSKIFELEDAKRQKQHKSRLLGTFIRNLATAPLALTEFNEPLWMTAVDSVKVLTTGKLIFSFRNGIDVEV